MDTISDQFNQDFNIVTSAMLERARESLLETNPVFTRENFVAQFLMDFLDDPSGDDPQGGGEMNANGKAALVRVADYMGPDWAQALYHAAVFITKVA